jgi:DNA repair protein RadC
MMKNKQMKYSELMELAAAYVAEERPTASDPKMAAAIVRPILQGEEQEVILAIYLNAKNRVIEIKEITRGLVDCSMCHPREVYRGAIMANACRVLVAHNHPSGDPKPSANDIQCTKDLVEAGKILQIELVDHIVIGDGANYVSLRESGLIQ